MMNKKWEMGIGNWELGIGNWELVINYSLISLISIPHPLFPIPHSQYARFSPILGALVLPTSGQ
jgi:hypothetical protein